MTAVYPAVVWRPYLLWLALLATLAAGPAQAQWNWFSDKAPLQVTVNDAFLNVYAGPGSGYPIFHVVERDEVITLLKSRTDWIKIETRRGLQGWIKRSDMLLTLSPDGSVPDFPDPGQVDYLEDRFELGVAYGDFAGADGLAFNLGYRFTRNLSAELRFDSNTGQFSDSKIMAAAVLFQPFPQWRVSPYFSVGAGTIKTYPSATLVEAEDRDDNLLQASLGSYIHLNGRLFLRLEYANHYVLTSRNTNEEVNEWKLGFNVFF
ncbi:SH3 domain-containing protein [Cellvibrio japonicus]|uniref:SH3b domain-containing protein n=1 Tax=Cellvibrio japonicus (strain Ueda107) TaxID=498211 RepID=B3PEG9_CELJU|nr:SH3 domain-containing protein [Cellvibrio japonicus]ACE83299.1 hypothetical protein CJA_3270 [Cellvibrio japonicus Ueda107]QEI13539.1 SH3 domain-containing protein [Cellvibrio japonicus]QEI17113.1 SH3 domain-containing protein [Cellvibrio japonicus]QEI20690.1 SH3 domain-containing protein [Cellvibrio japonicus]